MRAPRSLPLALAAALAAACAAPPPAAEEKPRRKSFEEGAEWRPASPDPGPDQGAAGAGGTEARAEAIEQKWEQVRQSGDEAERQRLANEALRETRALADQPSGQ